MRPETLLIRPLPAPKLTVGCPLIDRCLAGGVPCGSLTEITAESGSGKTQVCLQLALSAQLPTNIGGLSASSLYLHSEFPFPLRRLRQLARTQFGTFSHLFDSHHDPLDYVFVEPVHTADQLFDEMRKIESFIQYCKTQFPIKLIIIDSIAALFRSEFDNTPLDLKRRSSMFFKISGKLKLLAKRFGLAVVLTNQVVDVVSSNEGVNNLRVGNLGSLCSSGRQVCAALGLAWANCVNSRLFLSREEEIVAQGNESFDCDGGSNTISRTRRWLHVVFAPHLPKSSCEFVIAREGIRGIER